MDDLFGSDDDQQSELNDTPSPQQAHSHSEDRANADNKEQNASSHDAGLDDLFGSEEEKEESDNDEPVRKR